MQNALNTNASSKWVCVALNDLRQLDGLHKTFSEAPYKQPPTQPVLYFKPRNTWSEDGATFPWPVENQLVVGASLAVMIGKTCRRVSAEQALESVAGYRLLHDLSLPEQSYYRPDIKGKCLDHSAPISAQMVPVADVAAPNDLVVNTRVNGTLVSEQSIRQLQRDINELVHSISHIMTLQPGDLIAVGFPGDRIVLQPSDQLQSELVSTAGVQLTLNNRIGEASV